MATNILMPALSPTMEKGNLAKWLKKEGDTIKSGDIIAEIETDKATMEVEAVDEGILAKIVVPEGTADVAVNEIIGVIAARARMRSAVQRRPRPKAAKAEARRRLRRPRPKPAKPAAAPAAQARRITGRLRRRQLRPASGPSLRRWRGGWPRRPGSISRRSRARARMAASSRRISRRPRPAAAPRLLLPQRPLLPHRLQPSPPRRCRRACPTTWSASSSRLAPSRRSRMTACARRSRAA